MLYLLSSYKRGECLCTRFTYAQKRLCSGARCEANANAWGDTEKNHNISEKSLFTKKVGYGSLWQLLFTSYLDQKLSRPGMREEVGVTEPSDE